MKNLLSIISTAALLFSCVATSPYRSSEVSKFRNQDRIEASLFENDKSEITQEAVDKILNGQIEIKDSNKVAIYKVENKGTSISKYYGWNYWLSEEYLDLERKYFETVVNNLNGNKKIDLIKPLPSILTPKELSISKLREAAVRLQAKLLIIYSVQSDIFEDYNLFSANEVKAYSTCEMILFHTQTGIIPFSELVTKKVVEKEIQSDDNLGETRKRAESKAIIEALDELGKNLNIFLK
jgi:hypothetical protein